MDLKIKGLKVDGGPGSGPQPGGGPDRRKLGIGQARRKPARLSSPAEGEKEQRTKSAEGFVGRRKIKVTPQITPLTRKSTLIKTRL